ncbi:MAG TPA: hypothetical protein DIU35_02990 [Candidatus Latescibacteria bacterium]|nr:hypothetical protein [Gemmatimonadota bacterium]HCR16425.1 hypothetical protein [Candidatus Latescibacterota bacterium]
MFSLSAKTQESDFQYGDGRQVVTAPSGRGYDRGIRRTLLSRYGVIFRKIAVHEGMSPLWRELVRVCRRLEARGEIRGGLFVEGVWGEQFALPEVIPILRSVRKNATRNSSCPSVRRIPSI